MQQIFLKYQLQKKKILNCTHLACENTKSCLRINMCILRKCKYGVQVSSSFPLNLLLFHFLSPAFARSSPHSFSGPWLGSSPLLQLPVSSCHPPCGLHFTTLLDLSFPRITLFCVYTIALSFILESPNKDVSFSSA